MLSDGIMLHATAVLIHYLNTTILICGYKYIVQHNQMQMILLVVAL